jgi:hypothetical protein
MFVKKVPVVISSGRGYQKELDYLYARRVAINTLIQSLEEYDRHRAKRIEDGKRKSA